MRNAAVQISAFFRLSHPSFPIQTSSSTAIAAGMKIKAEAAIGGPKRMNMFTFCDRTSVLEFVCNHASVYALAAKPSRAATVSSQNADSAGITTAVGHDGRS